MSSVKCPPFCSDRNVLYSFSSLSGCIRSRQQRGSPDVWFVGDSRVRFLYATVSSQLSRLPVVDLKGYFDNHHHVENSTGMRLVSEPPKGMDKRLWSFFINIF